MVSSTASTLANTLWRCAQFPLCVLDEPHEEQTPTLHALSCMAWKAGGQPTEPGGCAPVVACRDDGHPACALQGVPYEDFVVNIQPDDYAQLNTVLQRILDDPPQLRRMQARASTTACMRAVQACDSCCSSHTVAVPAGLQGVVLTGALVATWAASGHE